MQKHSLLREISLSFFFIGRKLYHFSKISVWGLLAIGSSVWKFLSVLFGWYELNLYLKIVWS
jgi:hypothetical protein